MSAQDKPDKPKTKRKPGRPSSYTPEVADEILKRMSNGESLSAICREPGKPNIGTILDWQDQFPEFHQRYEKARQMQAMALVEGIFEIADDGTNDYTTDKDGNEVVNRDHIQRSRLRVDTRKWFASKVLPKLYGEKLVAELTGKDGGPIKIEDSTKAELIAAIKGQLDRKQGEQSQ